MDAHKTQRMASALTFLELYHKDGEEFLNHIITGDETWVSFVNVETKEQSKQRMHKHSPNKPKKFKQTLSARKLMATVFWDRKGMLMAEFMQQGTTTMSEVHCKTPNKLHRAIQNKRRGMLTSGAVLLHDNVHPHTAARTRALLENFNWELFDHPPYNPDLNPSDYHLFTYLKNWLGSQHCSNNEELIEGVKTWLSSMAADFFDTGIQKTYSLIQVPHSGGDYTEK
jgi:histone-lysine N-methyltransferase SETMAR